MSNPDDWDSHWDSFGEASDLSPGTAWRHELIIPELRINDWFLPLLIEIGCGRGEFASYISKHFAGLRYVGVDSSREAVKAAKAKVPTAFFRASIPIMADCAKNLVVCSEVVEHVDNPGFLLSTVARVMNAEDLIVITTPGGPLNEFYVKIGHRRHYSAAQLSELVERNGFTVTNAYECGWPFFNLYRMLLVLMGESVTRMAAKKPSLLTRVVLATFRFLFRFNSMKRGWQTIVVAVKK